MHAMSTTLAIASTTLLLLLLPASQAFQPLLTTSSRTRSSSRASTITCQAEKHQHTHDLSRAELLKRGLLTSMAGAIALGTGLPNAFAAEEEQSYYDEKYKVSFEHIPAGWPRTDTQVKTNDLDFRKLVVYKDPKSAANIFIAYTPVQPDFTTLGAFGSILDVAKTIVPKGRGVESKLLKYESRNGAYFFDYVVQPDRQPKRHLTTIFALITKGGVGEILATYTTNALEEQYEEVEPIFDKVTKSFNIGKQD